MNNDIKLIYAVGAIDESHVALFDELYKNLGSNFKVIINASLKSIGTGKTPYNRPNYEINFYNNKEEAWNAIRSANTLVIANTNQEIRKYAMKARKKLVFIEGERIRKKKFTVKEEIQHKLGMFFHHKIYQRKNLFWLCIGAYVERDLNEYGLYNKRCISWGYWPSLKIEKTIEKKYDGKNLKLLYVGQMIKIKRVEKCFDIAKEFEENGFNVQLDLLGSGPELERIKSLANQKPINSIYIHGRVPLEEVKKYLQEAHFYLSPSDYHDGWNMVINQALECGTPVISHEEVGSAKSLIIDGFNGYLYNDSNISSIINKVKFLSSDDYLKISKNSVLSFKEDFSPKSKALLLIRKIQDIL